MGAHFSKLGRTLDGAVDAYNKTVGSLERQVLAQARRFEQHGITGIEPPELQPIERQTRPLAAAEFVEPGQQTDARGALRRGRRRRCRDAGTSTVVDAFTRMAPLVVGLPSAKETRERRP